MPTKQNYYNVPKPKGIISNKRVHLLCYLITYNMNITAKP